MIVPAMIPIGSVGARFYFPDAIVDVNWPEVKRSNGMMQLVECSSCEPVGTYSRGEVRMDPGCPEGAECFIELCHDVVRVDHDGIAVIAVPTTEPDCVACPMALESGGVNSVIGLCTDARTAIQEGILVFEPDE